MRLGTQGIFAGYGGSDILHDVTTTCESGLFVGLIGPNGCGKSTLLRVLTRILRPRMGRVVLDAQPISGFSPRSLAQRIGFVPQEEKAAFDFAVSDVVLMGRFPHQRPLQSPTPEDYQHVARALAQTDILHLKDRPITTLSGGEHRRVLLARALAQQTPLLLLDEPTAHLDITHQVELLALVRDLTRREMEPLGAMAALHDLNQAAEFCDRLVLLHEGRLMAEGPPEDVLTAANLRRVYQADAQIGRNPVTGRPFLFALHPAREHSTPLPARSDNSIEFPIESLDGEQQGLL